ncbi:MAG: HD domain-containing protein [Planctomycetes bacterium]|nr:HD domain-containing protein [Planctomycetota bacterium]
MHPEQSNKQRILIVGLQAAVDPGCKRLLSERYQVAEARDRASALDLAREQGPFAVVVAEENGNGCGGLEALRELRAASPASVGVLLSDGVPVETLLGAVQAGDVFRCLDALASDEHLLRAVDESLRRHAEIESLRLGEDELEFVREALRSLNERFGERIAEQSSLLERLHRFAVDLSGADSMAAIADVTARAVSGLMQGRGVHVQLWGERELAVEAFHGPEMSSNLHEEPLLTRDGILGEITIDLGTRNDRKLDEHETHVLRSITTSCAVAVRNELRRGQREHAQQAMILALARLSEQRDEATGKHLERVSLYCKLVAEGLREDGRHVDMIDDAFIENLVRSAPLHDIGKVGIPDAILLKPGKLSPEEWQIMRTHAEIGAQTIESVMRDFPDQGFLVCGRDIARGHHEKWDGSGYPMGLKGEAIPLAARIVALSDVYDALTSARPYKQPWTHADALKWIVEQTGKHFDPHVVESFAKRAEQADAIRARLRDAQDEAAAQSAHPAADAR